MITILYTNSDQVLNTIGLSSDDLADSFFVARDFNRLLSVDLFTWLPTHAAINIPTGTPAASDQAQFNSDCLSLYCTYFCASKVLDATLAIMVKESDGQSEYNRFSSLDFAALSKETQQQAGYYRHLLLDAIHDPGAAVHTQQLTVVAPTYDPVTG
jgi:hypothetical protein